MNETDKIAEQVVDSAFAVHRELGPGLLESAYEACLAHELKSREFSVEVQKVQPVAYRGLALEIGYRLNLLVNDLIVIELKSVESLTPVHKAQLITYLKLSNKNMGFLINFNVPLIKDGIKCIANQFSET
jgi:GxxExxY protein